MKTPAKRTRGRPKGSGLFAETVGDEICHRLSNGEPLYRICLDDHMPAVRTVQDWVADRANYGEFSASYARARESWIETLLVRIERLVSTPQMGKTVTVIKGGGPNGDDVVEVCIRDMIEHRKLQVRTLMWLVICWSPHPPRNRRRRKRV